MTLAWIDALHGAGGPLLTIGALGASVVLLLALILLAVHNRRLHAAQATQAAGARPAFGSAEVTPSAETVRTPLDRVLLGHPAAFYALVLSISVVCWGIGLVLAPSKPRFLQSSEWHVQPFYLAAHLIALRLFIQLLVRKYAAGAAHLDIAPEKVANGIRRALGPRAWLSAAAIALPFASLDYRNLIGDRYETLSEDRQLYAIDYLMWGIWCAEWLLNALIWVTLAGFLAAALRADVRSGRIVRADVFAMPYHVETPFAVTPDLLPDYAGHFKGKFSVEMSRRLADELVRAIDGAQLEFDKWGSDLRWGAIFFDQSGTQLHSIYLNSCYYGGAGRSGYIDGIRVRLNGSLIVWFESNFSNGSQPCADGPSNLPESK